MDLHVKFDGHEIIVTPPGPPTAKRPIGQIWLCLLTAGSLVRIRPGEPILFRPKHDWRWRSPGAL